MPRAAGIISMVLKHTEKCVRPDCRVCGKLRALINDQFAIFVPTPPCVGDPGAQDPWASHPRLLTRPGGSQLSDAGDGSEQGSVAAEGHDSKRRRMSEFEQEDDDLVSLEEEEEEGEQEGTVPWQEQEQGGPEDHNAQPQPEQPWSPPLPLQPLNVVGPAASTARKRPRSAGVAPAGWTLEHGLQRQESGYESSSSSVAARQGLGEQEAVVTTEHPAQTPGADADAAGEGWRWRRRRRRGRGGR